MALDFKVIRIHKFDSKGATKAICDVAIANEFVIKGFRVIEGKNGLFVGAPQESGKDGKWYNRAFPITAQTREVLNKTVISTYMENND
ncbi:MAG: SpoVG family protein [Candidatus Omnitrophica bacterium]|nr:SpoVG family protein [Candidatus Omnitrophota bacterium]